MNLSGAVLVRDVMNLVCFFWVPESGQQLSGRSLPAQVGSTSYFEELQTCQVRTSKQRQRITHRKRTHEDPEILIQMFLRPLFPFYSCSGPLLSLFCYYILSAYNPQFYLLKWLLAYIWTFNSICRNALIPLSAMIFFTYVSESFDFVLYFLHTLSVLVTKKDLDVTKSKLGSTHP